MGLIHSFQAYIHTLTLHHIHFLKYDRDTTDCCCCSQSLWIPLQIRHTFISLHVQSSQPLQVLLLGTMLRFYCKFLQQLVLNSGLNREINKFVSYNLQQIIFKANIPRCILLRCLNNSFDFFRLFDKVIMSQLISKCSQLQQIKIYLPINSKSIQVHAYF